MRHQNHSHVEQKYPLKFPNRSCVDFARILQNYLMTSTATYMYELRSWMQVEANPTPLPIPTLAGKGCNLGQASILMVDSLVISKTKY